MSETTRTTISQGGRVVIPAELRKHFGWEEGQEVVLTADFDGLYISTPSQAWNRLQRLVSQSGSGESLVEALLSERRQEASRES